MKDKIKEREEEDVTDFPIRIGIKLMAIINKIIIDWEEKFGFKISNREAGEYLAKKIEKRGGVKV